MKKFIICILFYYFISLNAFSSLLQDINPYVINFYKKDYNTALKGFIKYSLSNPNDPDGYFWLGKTYQKLNNNIKAEENFKKAYELTIKEKNIEKLNFNNSSTLEDYFDMALNYFEAKNYSEADFYADLMLRLDRNSKSAYFIKAKIAQIKGDTDLSKEYMNKAILLDNNLLDTNLAKSLNIYSIPEQKKEIYTYKAYEAYFRGDINTAINNLMFYSAVDDKNVDVLNFLCDLYIKNNNLPLAKETLAKSLKVNNTNNIDAFINEAVVYSIEKNDKKELSSLLKAINVNPNNKRALLKLGEYYLKKGNFSEAKKYYKTLITLDDNLYEAYFGYIYSLIELDEIEEASVCFKKKMPLLKQKNGENEFLLAKICINAKEYSDALDFLNEALKKDDNLIFRAEIERVNALIKKQEQKQ